MSKYFKKYLIYLFILILPFSFLFFSFPFLERLKFKIVDVVSFPAQTLSFLAKEIKKILYYHHTFEEYKKLKQETGFLKSRLVGLEEVIKENNRLEKLLEFKRKSIYSSQMANVIGRDPSQWNATLIIDKGSRDGLRQGMPVIHSQGIVGKIAEVGLNKSKVILLTDPQFSVAAILEGSREAALVTGTIQGVCRLRYLNPEAQITKGEKVITSKLSASFPEGLLIGEVHEIQEGSFSQEAVIKPAVSISQIEEVLVIIK